MPSRDRPEPVPFQRGRKQSPRPAAPLAWIPPHVWTSLSAEKTDAHRLASASDRWLERFGLDLLFSYQREDAVAPLLAEIESRCAAYAFPPRRIFGKFLPRQAEARGAPKLLRGDPALPMETEITEAGLRFGLDFAGGYSAGFFIDQRRNREQVRQYRPSSVLNTFAYTCSFSVAAARVGARTVSIDLSRRSLERGEENFRRNGFDPKAGHQFIADDVLAVLPRISRRGEKFDVIILDPPTFSRNQSGAPFQVQRDFGTLLASALEIVAPKGKILLSVNHSEMRVGDLEHSARAALRIAKRSGHFQVAPPLPDFPPDQGAKTIWLELN